MKKNQPKYDIKEQLFDKSQAITKSYIRNFISYYYRIIIKKKCKSMNWLENVY